MPCWLFLIFIIVLVFLLWQWQRNDDSQQPFRQPSIEASYDNLHYFNPNDFPYLVSLSQYTDLIAEEAKNITAVSSIKRKQYEWTGFQDAEKFFSQLGDNTAWFYSWDSSHHQDGKDNWLNYPLMYGGKIIGQAEEVCPQTCQLLKNIPGINIAGFSRIKAGTRIYPHTDTTGLISGTLAYHLGLIGEANLFVISSVDHHSSETDVIFDHHSSETDVIFDHHLYQHHQPGKMVVVNTNKQHYVENPYPEDRIILYIDFRLIIHDFRSCQEQ